MYNREELIKKAPAIYAKEPSAKVSDKYTFVPTYKILDMLKENGYQVVSAEQQKTRAKGFKQHGKHLVRLRHSDYMDESFKGGDIPEILIINSHDGRKALSFFFGIFRLICENGLIISSLNLMSYKSKHIHFEYEVFESIVEDYMTKTDHILEQIEVLSSVNLTEKRKKDFAKEAKNIVWPSGSLIPEEMLIKPRREADEKDDLYTIFNVVQENALKGAIEYSTPKRRVKTKEVKAIDRKLRINLELWQLAESFI